MFVPNTSNSSARPPTEIGVNATVIVQVAFAARVEAQVVEATEKSPFTPQPRDCSASGPSFLIVITCPALVVPTGWLPKARLGWRVDSCASEVVEVKVPLTPLWAVRIVYFWPATMMLPFAMFKAAPATLAPPMMLVVLALERLMVIR